MAKAKILVLEDDPFSIQLLRYNLKNYDAEVLPIASTAEEALKVLSQYEPDVALLDIYLAGEQSGLDVARAIKETCDIPIIFLTGYSSDEIINRAKLTEPFGYLLKPYTPRELTVTLDMALYKHGISKRLSESRATLSATLEALSDAVLTTDLAGKIIYANPVAKAWLGESEGKSVGDVLVLKSAQGEAVAFSPELFGGEKKAPLRLQKREASAWVQVVVRPAPEAHGQVVVIRDVTAEYEGARAAQAVFEALESLEEGLLLVEGDAVIFASRGFEKLTGWTRGEALGKSAEGLFGGEGGADFFAHARTVVSARGYHKAERIICTHEGSERLFDFQFTRMASVEGADKMIIQMRDITDIRQVEEDFRQSQKIEAVGRLAGGVAHDFNNLLSVINSYSDLLTMKLPAEDPLNKYVSNIRAAGQRAADLVSKLLTFSRRDSSKPTLLDVRSVTEEIHKMLRRVIREDIALSLDFEGELGALWADQLGLEQVLMNLCVNARDAINGAGKISVVWRSVALDEAAAGHLNLAAGKYLAMSVTDTGCGMDEKTIERIFEPYFTTKGQGKGTGLGLSIVYSVVKQLKGHIDLKSKVGEGTTFTVYLPESDKVAATKTTAAASTKPTEGDEHILMVEDEESFADCVKGVLSLHGYQVHYAPDAESALEQAKASLYPIKLLISDMTLPGMSGQEMAKKLRAEHPEMKIIFMTGYDNALQILQDFPYTALVLQKPFSVVSVLEKIREVLDAPQSEKKIQLL